MFHYIDLNKAHTSRPPPYCFHPILPFSIAMYSFACGRNYHSRNPLGMCHWVPPNIKVIYIKRTYSYRQHVCMVSLSIDQNGPETIESLVFPTYKINMLKVYNICNLFYYLSIYSVSISIVALLLWQNNKQNAFYCKQQPIIRSLF